MRRRHCDEFEMVYVCVCVYVAVSGHRTHDEEPLPLPIFIHDNDVVQRSPFASQESAQSL